MLLFLPPKCHTQVKIYRATKGLRENCPTYGRSRRREERTGAETWGFHDGIRGYDFFFDMPLTFGMQGDKPPSGRGGFFGGGPVWWRPGGYFSKPLLARKEICRIAK